MKYKVFWKNPGYKVRPSLKKDIECDYLIVGGGITGVSLAYFLAKDGAKNVILVEKEKIASGATGRAAGTLVLKGELDLKDIIKDYGKEKGRLYWKANHEGFKLIKELIKKEKIDCDFEKMHTLYCGYKNKTYNDVVEEYKAEKQFEKKTKLLVGNEIKKEINTNMFDKVVLSYDHGISVNPLKLTQNISMALENKGVKVYENTHVTKVGKNIAKTPHAKIKFKKLIWAIDSAHPSEKVKNLKSTIIVTRPLTNKEVESTGLKGKIIWDSKENYKYTKLTKDNRMLVGFGGIIVHKKHRIYDPHFPHLKELKNFIPKIFPRLNPDIEYTWSGSFGITDDYYPIIEFKKNQISIAGAGSQVVCVMAAKYLADKLAGKKSYLDNFFKNKLS